MHMPRVFALFSTFVICGFSGITLLSPTAAQDVVVRPRPILGPLDNPMKGWCPYPNAGEIHQPYSMVFQYVRWRELEPVENDFRFDDWEKTWDNEHGKDKHVIFRVFIDYPKKSSGLPDWLRNQGVKETAYQDHGGGMSPDYNDPKMIKSMERLIAALGKRYNNHPRVAFIQIGLLGFWGEWHTYPRPALYATPATEQRILEAYRKAFPDKSLMVRYARDYAGKQPWIGFHDDMFPEDTDNAMDWSFLAGLRKSQRTDNWKVAVVGGEMVPGKAEQWLGNEFATTLTMLQRAHFTWIGPYCPALTNTNDPTFRQRSEELVRKMGYEYQIDQARHPAEVKAKQTARVLLHVRNNGVAPFYYPWSVEWALIDMSGNVIKVQKTDWDLRKWLPGEFTESTELNMDVPAGIYRLAIGVRDPWKDRPSIRFANDLPVIDGWTILSEIKIVK
jgi:hypothetical protein